MLLDREFITPIDYEWEKLLKDSPLGVFLAFVTKDDAHSPVMLPVYDQLVKYAEDQIPLRLADARDYANQALCDDLNIFSVPTLVWLQNDRMPHFRLVGTVMKGKLEQEFDKALAVELAA